MVWGLLSGVFLVGGAMVALGLRGRRVGREPHCGWCNEALGRATGKGSETGALCEVCGGSLVTAGGTRAGRWRRGWVLIAAGSLSLVLSLSVMVMALNATSPAWLSRAPVSALVLQARHTGEVTSEAALNELLRRHEDAPLPVETLGRLVGPALALIEPGAEFSPENPWHRLLDSAFAAGAVGTEDATLYAKLALGELVSPFPDRVLAAQPQNARSRYPRAQGYEAPSPAEQPNVLPHAPITFGVSVLSATLNGEPLTTNTDKGNRTWWMACRSYGAEWSGAFGVGRTSSSTGLPVDFSCGTLRWPELQTGTHTLKVRWGVYAALEARESLYVQPRFDRTVGALTDPPPLSTERFPVRWEFETTQTVIAFASPEEMIRLVTSADGMNLDADAIDVRLELSISRQRTGDRPWEEVTDVTLAFDRRDAAEDAIPVVGSIELRAPEGRWPLYDAAPPDSQYDESNRVRVELLWPRGGLDYILDGFPDLPRSISNIDIIIVPDVTRAAEIAATGRHHLDAIWGEEIVIEGVPIDWSQLENAVLLYAPEPP